MAWSMSAGLGRDCRSSFTSGAGGDSQTGAGRACEWGGVRSGGPGGKGGKCEISRRPATLGPRAGGGGGGPGRPRAGGGLGGGSLAAAGAARAIRASGADGGTAGACIIVGGVGSAGPDRDARSSVAARLSSSALTARPASVAASTARLSHTMASYRSPCFQSAAPVVSPHATSSASLSSGEGNAGNMTVTRYRRANVFRERRTNVFRAENASLRWHDPERKFEQRCYRQPLLCFRAASPLLYVSSDPPHRACRHRSRRGEHLSA
jgi:hypothetical protein